MGSNARHDAALTNADLAPTQAGDWSWTAWNYAALWLGMAACIPTYTLASRLIELGWSWPAAVTSIVLGSAAAAVVVALSGHAGAQYGISFPVLARASFGVHGAKLPALLRAGVACGWFGIQSWIGGWALYALVQVAWPMLESAWPPATKLPELLPAWLANPEWLTLPEWVGIGTGPLACFLAFWALNVLFAMTGPRSAGWLASLAAPFLLAGGVALLVWAWRAAGGIGPMLAGSAPTGIEPPSVGAGAALGAGVTAAIALWASVALNSPDFTRYAKSQGDQAWGQAFGLPVAMAAFALIGVAVTSATVAVFGERIADPVALLSRIGGPPIVAVSLGALVLATLTANLAANVVASGLGFGSLAPGRISYRKGVLLTAVLGVAVMPWKLYDDAAAYIFTWLIGYGALLGPIAGVILVDYFLLRRRFLELDDLYRRGGRYEYLAGVNPVALVALAVGVAPSVPGFLAALDGTHDVGPLLRQAYDWAWLAGFLLAGCAHLLGMIAFHGFRKLREPELMAPEFAPAAATPAPEPDFGPGYATPAGLGAPTRAGPEPTTAGPEMPLPGLETTPGLDTAAMSGSMQGAPEPEATPDPEALPALEEMPSLDLGPGPEPTSEPEPTPGSEMLSGLETTPELEAVPETEGAPGPGDTPGLELTSGVEVPSEPAAASGQDATPQPQAIPGLQTTPELETMPDPGADPLPELDKPEGVETEGIEPPAGLPGLEPAPGSRSAPPPKLRPALEELPLLDDPAEPAATPAPPAAPEPAATAQPGATAESDDMPAFDIDPDLTLELPTDSDRTTG